MIFKKSAILYALSAHNCTQMYPKMRDGSEKWPEKERWHLQKEDGTPLQAPQGVGRVGQQVLPSG